jgi:hypothetical protein
VEADCRPFQGAAVTAFKTVPGVIEVDQSDRDLKTAISLCQKSTRIFSFGCSRSPRRRRSASRLPLCPTPGLAAIKRTASRTFVELTTSEIPVAPVAFGDVAAAHARYVDISLIGWEPTNPISRMTAEGLMFGTGRPVVLLPDTAEIGSIDHVAIAWDGSRVAARAVADAPPFLQRA